MFLGMCERDACALAGVLFFVVALWLVIPFNRPTISRSETLKMLLHVFTPCCSCWPSYYVSLATARQSKRIQIALHVIIQDIISGQIELRTPENTLEQMMSGHGQLEIETWRFSFSYRTLRLKILYWSCVWTMFPGKYFVSSRWVLFDIYIEWQLFDICQFLAPSIIA